MEYAIPFRLVVVMSHFELSNEYVDTDGILSSRSLASCATSELETMT